MKSGSAFTFSLQVALFSNLLPLRRRGRRRGCQRFRVIGLVRGIGTPRTPAACPAAAVRWRDEGNAAAKRLLRLPSCSIRR